MSYLMLRQIGIGRHRGDMSTEQFASLPIFTVVETDDWFMVKTGVNNWQPVGCETFDDDDEHMASRLLANGEKYYANPKVVALGGTGVAVR
jgi:hypothetical protein